MITITPLSKEKRKITQFHPCPTWSPVLISPISYTLTIRLPPFKIIFFCQATWRSSFVLYSCTGKRQNQCITFRNTGIHKFSTDLEATSEIDAGRVTREPTVLKWLVNVCCLHLLLGKCELTQKRKHIIIKLFKKVGFPTHNFVAHATKRPGFVLTLYIFEMTTSIHIQNQNWKATSSRLSATHL